MSYVLLFCSRSTTACGTRLSRSMLCCLRDMSIMDMNTAATADTNTVMTASPGWRGPSSRRLGRGRRTTATVHSAGCCFSEGGGVTAHAARVAAVQDGCLQTGTYRSRLRLCAPLFTSFHGCCVSPTASTPQPSTVSLCQTDNLDTFSLPAHSDCHCFILADSAPATFPAEDAGVEIIILS